MSRCFAFPSRQCFCPFFSCSHPFWICAYNSLTKRIWNRQINFEVEPRKTAWSIKSSPCYKNSVTISEVNATKNCQTLIGGLGASVFVRFANYRLPSVCRLFVHVLLKSIRGNSDAEVGSWISNEFGSSSLGKLPISFGWYWKLNANGFLDVSERSLSQLFILRFSDFVRSWHSPRALWTLNGTYRPTVNTRRKTGLSFIGWSFKFFWFFFRFYDELVRWRFVLEMSNVIHTWVFFEG